MTDLASVVRVGERIASMLRARRDALAASQVLAPLPEPFDIQQVSVGRLAAGPAGLSITCFQITPSQDLRTARLVRPDQVLGSALRLDLHFLLAARSTEAAEEQAMIAWAIAEFDRHSVLTDDATKQDIHLTTVFDWPPLIEVWRALGLDYRLSFVLLARGVALEERPAPALPPVITGLGVGPT